MASSPITSWQIDGETMETMTDFIFLGTKITANGDCSHEIKRCLLLGRKTVTNLDNILKNRDITLLEDVCIFKAMVFSGSRVWMWVLDHKESREPKNWCFWTVVLERTPKGPLDSKEIKPVNPKGNQSWIFIWRTGAEAEALICWPPDAKNWLIGKDPDARKDWRQGEKGMTEDEMFGWYHWLNGQEFEQAPGSWWWTGRPGMLQSMESQRARHDWATEPNWYTSAVDNQCSCLSCVQITMWLNTLLRYFCIDAAPSVSLSVKWGPTVAHAPPLLQKALDHKYRYFRRAPVQEADQNFHVGLQLCSSGHQSFNKLIWIHHSCHITYK